MITAEPEEFSAGKLRAMGYCQVEAHLVMRTAAMNGLPLQQFATDLMTTSIHSTGHQLMAIWQGCSSAKVSLSLVWPQSGPGSMINGGIFLSGLPSRMSSRQSIVVSGAVAEWLMRLGDAASDDEWDLFDGLRDCTWMSQEEFELSDGKITWHAVSRARRLLQRHWNIVGLSAASKRRDLLSRLSNSICAAHPRDARTDHSWRRPSKTSGSSQSFAVREQVYQPPLGMMSRREERAGSGVGLRWSGR